MLISHTNQFIFIHLYKNAGSSITQALLPYAEQGWRFGVWRSALRLGVNLRSLAPQPLPAHVTADRAEKQLGARVWRDYFTFAFVRNPWDWQVSLYTYMLKEPAHRQHALIKALGSFSNYVNWRCCSQGNIRLQRSFLYRGDKPLVGFIGRYESLNDDFTRVCRRVRIAATLPRINVSNSRPYQEFYDKHTRELVASAFRDDIKTFGYRFDN